MKTSIEFLKSALATLPVHFSLTPVNQKRPYLTNWQSIDTTRDDIGKDIISGKADGYGIKLGTPSCGICAIDIDGTAARVKLFDIMGDDQMPITVEFASGKLDRSQRLFTISQELRDSLKSKSDKIPNGDTFEELGFFWTGRQSVLPPSAHPETEGYFWVHSPDNTSIAPLPTKLLEYWLNLINPPRSVSSPKPRSSTKISTDVYSIPIDRLLTKEHRSVLGGTSQGGRNNAGASLARDLIGVAAMGSIECDYREKDYTLTIEGNPEELFQNFCDGCTPPLTTSEAETIWESAQTSDNEPCIRDKDILKNCARGYLKEVLPKVLQEKDRQVIDSELSQTLKESLDLKNGKAPNLFGGELGNLLSIAAGNFNIPVEILNFCLLPILGSQIKSEIDLLINPGTDYKVRAIRWCALVGETGTKKSPVIDILTGAMSSIQREVADRYKAEKLEYDAAFRAWKATKPADRDEEPAPVTPMMDLYFDDFTIESISASVSNHPGNGYLVYNDELAGFFKSMDAYRKNGGGDRQKWLTLYNGGALKVNRKSSETIFIPQTSVSIVGGIQPTTIEHLISGDESQEDGLWNRFTFARLPQTRIDAFSNTPHSLTEHLETLYRSLACQESFRHYLSEESKPLWAEWHVWTEDKTFSESSWIARGTYAKIEGIAARNALIIHRTMAAIAGMTPDRQISASTMATAIEWTKWELSQTLLEYQILGLTNDPEQSRILKFIDKFSGKGWVSARDVDRWWSARAKPSANELRQFMAKVVKLGQAIDNDEPIDSGKYRIQISSKGSNSRDKNPVNDTEKQTQQSLALVTNSKPKATKLARNGDLEFVTKFPANVSDKLGSPLNGDVRVSVDNLVSNASDNTNDIHSNNSRDSVSTVTTDPNKNIFKIGDYAKTGDDIVVITEIKEDYMSGRDKDTNLIGGHPNLFTIASPEDFAATQGEVDDEWN